MEFLHRTWAEIDVDALVHNFGIIKKEAAGAKIMAGGGTLVCAGTPETVAACETSYTGQYLKKYLF